jgi:steroid 5-alpha reductase family enzyme
MISIPFLLLLGFFGMFVLMSVLWLVHLFTKNAAIVDVGWSLGLLLLVILYGAFTDTLLLRKVLVVGMAALAYGRLATFLFFTRVLGHPEEGRYVALRKKWGKNIALRFFIFFQYQTIFAVIFSVPFLLVLNQGQRAFLPMEWLGVGLWLIAFVGEALADAQLRRFKRNPKNKGQLCQQGLWYYSRHPNYFFQWLMWWSYFLMAWHAPLGWLAILGPVLMGWFLLFVTGIPATEAQLLRSKGDSYRKYQKSTSPFVPWFRRR